MWCVHFNRPYSETDRNKSRLEYLAAPGQCTLSPEWKEVSGRHYCGQWMTKADNIYGDTALAHWYLNIDASGKMIEQQRAEIKRLKEVNRKLKEKLRDKNHAPLGRSTSTEHQHNEDDH